MLNMLLHTTFLFSAALVSQVLGSDSVWNSDLAVNGAHDRLLRAAKRDNGLGRRDVKGCLSHNHHLHYVDGKGAHDFLIYQANISTTQQIPMHLILSLQPKWAWTSKYQLCYWKTLKTTSDVSIVSFRACTSTLTL
jgi:hypothetical protein